ICQGNLRTRCTVVLRLAPRWWCTFVSDHCGGGARPIEEIVERPGVEPLETIGRLALERPQRLDLFLNGNANALRMASARSRLDFEGRESHKRQPGGECCGDPALLPINRRSILGGNHDARSKTAVMTSCPDSEVRIIVLQPRLRTSETKETSNLLIWCGFGSEVRIRTRCKNDADFRTATLTLMRRCLNPNETSRVAGALH